MFNLKNKRIAVYGMGVSGLSALRFIKSLEGEAIALNGGLVETWAKLNDKGEGVLKYVSKENCFNENDPKLKSELEKVDFVILSPGIPRDHEVLKPVNDKKIPIWGEIELAYRYLEATQNLSPMIGITGTNGKTTTTTFLGEMIEADKKSVFVGISIEEVFRTLNSKRHCAIYKIINDDLVRVNPDKVIESFELKRNQQKQKNK